MDPFKRFRVFSVQLTLVLTAIAAALAYRIFGREAALGLLMGGIGGSLAFWIHAVQVERVANRGERVLRSSAYVWTLIRIAIYIAVLSRAYTLDRQGLYGFWGAAAGLLIIRAAVIFFAFTGLDINRREN